MKGYAMYDLAIIGAGPAGSTVARLLGNRYRILVVDKRDLDQPISSNMPRPGQTKCCGGLLAPDAQRMLARFGLGIPANILENPQIFIVRTIDLNTRNEQYYQRHYLNMNREAFDRWLVSLIPGNAACRFQTVLNGIHDQGDHFTVHLSSNGQSYEEQARFIIGADGAFSKVRRLIEPVSTIPAYISIQEWFETLTPSPCFSAVFDSEITDFYCWTIPKEGSLIVGAALKPGPGAIAKFQLLKTKLADYGFSLQKSTKKEGCHLLRPASVSQLILGQGRIALIGEAAGWISPSSAEGLSYAMHSAWLLAETLSEGTGDFIKRYRRKSIHLQTNILLKNFKSPFMYHPWLRNRILSLGIKAIKIIS